MNLIELTKKLVEFQSYTGNDKVINDCLEFCINYFSNNPQIYIKLVEKNNVKSVLISNIDTMDFDVVEVGHIDVVPANDLKMFKPKIESNIMYGRGVGDMKGSVAAAMKLFDYVIENSINLKYGLLIVTDEELGGFDGAKYWTEDLGLKTKILLDADSGNELDRIIYKSKGYLIVKLVSHGKKAHGSKPWLGIDANDVLINTINNLRKIFPCFSKNNIPDDEWITTMHVSIMQGGESLNTIASYAECIIDFRYIEKDGSKAILKNIKDCLDGCVDLIVQKEGCFMFQNINNKYLQTYKNIIEKTTNKPVKFDFTTGASDARYFTINKDTVIISNQANCGDLHGDNEWLNIKKLEEFLEIRKEFINSINLEQLK